MNEELKRGPGRPAKAELFPVLLLKNYRPAGDFQIEQAEEPGKVYWRDPDGAEKLKTRAGFKIQIGKDEARTMIAKGIAERGDAI
jgi:hypothetical protein